MSDGRKLLLRSHCHVRELYAPASSAEQPRLVSSSQQQVQTEPRGKSPMRPQASGTQPVDGSDDTAIQARSSRAGSYDITQSAESARSAAKGPISIGKSPMTVTPSLNSDLESKAEHNSIHCCVRIYLNDMNDEQQSNI